MIPPTRERSRGRSITATLVSGFVLLLGIASAHCEDRVTLVDGTVLTVDEVSYAGYDIVEYKKDGKVSSQESSKVTAIEYGDAPGYLRLARERRVAKDFKNAANLLKAAIAAPDVRAWIQIDGSFELGETLREWARRDSTKYSLAVDAYDSALADPKSRLRPNALFGRALARAGAGDLASALSDLVTLKTEAVQNHYGIAWELNADLERTSLLLDAGKPEARQAVYELEARAIRESTNPNLDDATRQVAIAVKGRTRLVRGRLQLTDGHADQALSTFEAIRADGKEASSLRVAAQVAAGLALRAMGKLKDAQLVFARVRVLERTERESVSEAMYWLGIVCEELGAAEPRGAALAQEYFHECVERYDETVFAEKARRKLR